MTEWCEEKEILAEIGFRLMPMVLNPRITSDIDNQRL